MPVSEQTRILMSIESCRYLSVCQGCHFEKMAYSEQLEIKKNHLAELFQNHQLQPPPIAIRSLGENYLRQRFDFTIHNGRMGLYSADREIIDIESCQQVASELQKAFSDFRSIPFPIKKGSVRLRVGPSGLRGVWLDFANTDIKNLLDEKNTLERLWKLGFHIEIGQKGKVPIPGTESYKLSAPQPHVWFKTQDIPLKSLILNFTQPSWNTADALTEIILKWVSTLGTQLTVAEFGSGIGQFTLPLLASGHNVDSFESHILATELLRLNATDSQLDKNLTIYCDDYHKKPLPSDLFYDVAVVNPPRSGLLQFSDQLIRVKTKNVIYISCFPESLIEDLEKLLASGYQIKEIQIVDQFPQTKHYETCVLLERIDF
ncbi:MAG: hypothetical protein A2622_12230 [Bdellovibrionales bacterium RIFCSPHIGHO2_01_FULL_40_29]|nr:MAG: hypothetical protein A2622_12230 [Bdellovibrionales bacterium RIFCSPHIGHO2_01_FULL_40_29]OFZ32956.1 MAG: hypothetical protein A3D17_09535 [Bdellovibrionales bacterium RIFCSPHIGHO2_02_FULL_40_15]